MEEKFKWVKFILDCFICFGLMIVSYIIFFFPIIFIYELINIISIYAFSVEFHLGTIEILKLSDFGNYALLFTLCCISFFIVWFILEKKGAIRYKIYKPSFWFVFIAINSFWWLAAYSLANGGFSK